MITHASYMGNSLVRPRISRASRCGAFQISLPAPFSSTDFNYLVQPSRLPDIAICDSEAARPSWEAGHVVENHIGTLALVSRLLASTTFLFPTHLPKYIWTRSIREKRSRETPLYAHDGHEAAHVSALFFYFSFFFSFFFFVFFSRRVDSAKATPCISTYWYIRVCVRIRGKIHTFVAGTYAFISEYLCDQWGRAPVSITWSRRPLRYLSSCSSSSISLLFRSSYDLSKER